jgi:hypothetical protein
MGMLILVLLQVHKAKLRMYDTPLPAPVRLLTAPVRATGGLFRRLVGRPDVTSSSSSCVHVVQEGDTAWTIANTHGVSLEHLKASNRHNSEAFMEGLAAGECVYLPDSCCNSGAAPPCFHCARVHRGLQQHT